MSEDSLTRPPDRGLGEVLLSLETSASGDQGGSERQGMGRPELDLMNWLSIRAELGDTDGASLVSLSCPDQAFYPLPRGCWEFLVRAVLSWFT